MEGVEAEAIHAAPVQSLRSKASTSRLPWSASRKGQLFPGAASHVFPVLETGTRLRTIPSKHFDSPISKTGRRNLLMSGRFCQIESFDKLQSILICSDATSLRETKAPASLRICAAAGVEGERRQYVLCVPAAGRQPSSPKARRCFSAGSTERRSFLCFGLDARNVSVCLDILEQSNQL